MVNDRIDYKDPDNKSRGYKVREGKTDLNGVVTPVRRGRFSAPPPPYSTVTESGGGYARLINDSDVFFSFDLTTRSSSLNKQNYTDYQQFLYDIISQKLDKGMNYKEIAEWLNDNGYKTVRGSKFKNNHTHSIVKKKRLSNHRHTKTYPSELSNCSLEIYDKRLINA